MKFNNFTRLLLAFVATLAMGGAYAQQTLKLGHVLPQTSYFGFASSVYADEVKKRTNGRYVLKEFPAGQLGGEREMVESVQLGTLDLAITSTGPIPNFVPEAGIFDIPFLFRDAKHGRAVLDSAIGEKFKDKFKAKGLILLAWSDQSFRNMTNNKRPVATPEDAKGLKLRTMENPIHIAGFEAMGVLATPMSFTEVPSALQQGTIDGQESPIPTIVSLKFSQTQKYLSLTRHIYSPVTFLASPSLYSKLSKEDQQAFQDAAKAAADALRLHMDEQDEKGLAQLKSDGMQIIEISDTSIFQDALKPAYQAYAKKFGQGQLDEIINLQ